MKFWTLENAWKASRFWRTEPWKEKLALIEISPVMVLSWECTEDVSLPQQLILRWFFLKTAVYWSEELRDKVSHYILLPWQLLPQESNEIINYAQISGWPLTVHTQRRHKIVHLEKKKFFFEMLFGQVLKTNLQLYSKYVTALLKQKSNTLQRNKQGLYYLQHNVFSFQSVI